MAVCGCQMMLAYSRIGRILGLDELVVYARCCFIWPWPVRIFLWRKGEVAFALCNLGTGPE